MFGELLLSIFIFMILWVIIFLIQIDFLGLMYDLKHDYKLTLGSYSAKKDLVKLHKLLFKLSWEEFGEYFYKAIKYRYIDDDGINITVSVARLHYPEKIPDGLTADFIITCIDLQSEYWNSDKRTFADICDAFKAAETHKVM